MVKSFGKTVIIIFLLELFCIIIQELSLSVLVINLLA